MQKRQRLEQDAKVALSNIILYKVKDPSVTGLITVTDVKITPDQKYAQVYVSIFGKQNKENVIDALKKAKGYIRSELGKTVKMRNVPELVFELDDSMEYGAHMDKVISEVMKKDNQNKD